MPRVLRGPTGEVTLYGHQNNLYGGTVEYACMSYLMIGWVGHVRSDCTTYH